MQVLAITIQKEIAKTFLSVYFLKCKLAFQIIDDKRFRVTWLEPKLKVWCKKVSENLSRLIPTSSCTIMHDDASFQKDDGSKYEREASKQWG